MEQLPDELWLSVFAYLHQYDILYSFNNLNLRFEKIIQSITSTINLSDLSYKLFSRFCREILPIHGHHIHYLIIKGAHQRNFFRDNENLLKQMNYLQCLTLIGPQYSNELINFYVKHFPSISSLHLKLGGGVKQPLEDILSNHLLLLTDLNLLVEDIGIYCFDNMRIVRRFNFYLPRLKILTIQNLKSTSDLYYLFKIMCNLEEISLSVDQFDRQPLLNDLVPKSLNTMRLDLTCTIQNQEVAKMLREFLFLFKKPLESLKLVINCIDKYFGVELHELLKTNLPHLTSFTCSIDIFDSPARLPTGATAEQCLAEICSASLPKITLQWLKNQTALSLNFDDCHSKLSSLIIPDNTLLPKLRKVLFFHEHFYSDSTMLLYSELLSISQNVTILEIHHSDSKRTIDLLSKLSTKTKLMIKKLKCSNTYKECIFGFHSTFLEELSQILPKL